MKNKYFTTLQLFKQRWDKNYHPDELFIQKHHYRLCKQAIDAPDGFKDPDAEDINKKMDSFFANREPWLVSCRHNIAVFFKHFNRWTSPEKRSKKSTGLMVQCTDCDALHPVDQPLCDKCWAKQRTEVCK